VKSPLPPPTPPAHRVLRKGDTLETYGTGRFTQGYFGGIMDAATGLIGACPECNEGLATANMEFTLSSPATGRFLTRNARPEQNNPYTPIDPTGALLGPLALLALAYGTSIVAPGMRQGYSSKARQPGGDGWSFYWR
jgi:hypothetical protein